MKLTVLSAAYFSLIIMALNANTMIPGKQQRAYLDITEFWSTERFESIKRFILQNGDRKTYRNKDNHNPHYRLESFDLYLNPGSTGNIESTAILRNYNEIVIYDPNNAIQYFIIRIVRNENERRSNANRWPDLKPGHTYLLNEYDEDILKMKEDLLNRYLDAVFALAAKTP